MPSESQGRKRKTPSFCEVCKCAVMTHHSALPKVLQPEMFQMYICARLSHYCLVIPVTPAFLHVLSGYFRWFQPLRRVHCCVLGKSCIIRTATQHNNNYIIVSSLVRPKSPWLIRIIFIDLLDVMKCLNSIISLFSLLQYNIFDTFCCINIREPSKEKKFVKLIQLKKKNNRH